MAKSSKLLVNLVQSFGPARLQQIQEELFELSEIYPGLFPTGVPIVTGPVRRSKKGSAQDLIDGAENMHKQRAGYITVGEAAKLANVTDSTIRNWLKAGKVKHTDTDGAVRVLQADVEQVTREREARKSGTESS